MKYFLPFFFVLGSCESIMGPSQCANCSEPGPPNACMEDGQYIPRMNEHGQYLPEPLYPGHPSEISPGYFKSPAVYGIGPTRPSPKKD